jgi:hypothetical protein
MFKSFSYRVIIPFRPPEPISPLSPSSLAGGVPLKMSSFYNCYSFDVKFSSDVFKKVLLFCWVLCSCGFLLNIYRPLRGSGVIPLISGCGSPGCGLRSGGLHWFVKLLSLKKIQYGNNNSLWEYTVICYNYNINKKNINSYLNSRRCYDGIRTCDIIRFKSMVGWNRINCFFIYQFGDILKCWCWLDSQLVGRKLQHIELWCIYK